MKVINNLRKDFFMEGGQSMVREHKMPGRHITPHERKALMNIEFEQSDWELLRKIFGDADTAFAAAEILREAPPEIQILAIQIINVIGISSGRFSCHCNNDKRNYHFP